MKIDAPWFTLTELLLVVGACGLWVLLPGVVTWQPLLLAGLPWVWRMALGQRPFPRTRLDLWLWLFLATAGIGVGIAYDHGQAWAKFWILLGAVFLYYALAEQPVSRINGLMAGGTAVALLIALYFVLTFDWQNWTADFSWLTALGKRVGAIQPSLSWSALHPNKAAGLIAMFLPMGTAVLWRSWQQKQWRAMVLSLIAVIPMLFTLLLTSSRGAWGALFVSALFLMGYYYWLRFLKGGTAVPWRTKLIGLVGASGILIIFGWVLLQSLHSMTSSVTRLQLYRQTWMLIADFPFTGSGLATFDGLYSQYIRLIPFFFFNYGHNLFLDVWLTQGPVAFVALLVLLGGSVWQLLVLVRQNPTVERFALLGGMLVIILHGLIDDPLYGFMGTPLLFVFPGLAAGLANAFHVPIFENRSLVKIRRYGLPVLAVLLALLFFSKGVKARWYANLGALTLAHGELVDWPHNSWDYEIPAVNLKKARQQSLKALALNANDVTAQYRLGLMALYEQDFTQAVLYLQAAYRARPTHRGIQKALGYSLAWAGKTAVAADILRTIPEAAQELANYRQWWRQQGRTDLALQAERVYALLQN